MFESLSGSVWRPRHSGDPKIMSLVLVLLALYGDLAKRIFTPSVALYLLYGCAALILAFMLLSRHDRSRRRPTTLSTLAGLLILIYIAQLLTSFSSELTTATMAAMYVCLPLSFTFLIPLTYPQFDLRALAFYTTVLMVPVHAVGAIQAFVDPTFMLSTAYSLQGGVIFRNFLEDPSTFIRFPSIFASE